MTDEGFSEIQLRLREGFLEEAAGLIDRLEESLLALERFPGDQGWLNEAFRAAHTIKGSAAGVGLGELSTFTHQLENALDALRSHRCELTADGAAALLEGVDLLSAHLAAAGTKMAPPETDGWIRRLAQAFPLPRGASVPASAESARAGRDGANRAGLLGELTVPELRALEGDIPGESGVYLVQFVLPGDTFARGLDPIALLGALSEEAELLHVTPLVERIPRLEEIDPTCCYLGFRAVVATGGPAEDLRAIFEFCPDGSSVEVIPLERAAPGASATGHGDELPGVVGSGDWKMLGEILVEEKLLMPEDLEKALAKQREGLAPGGGDGRTIRVKQERLDGFMNQVGELVTARNALLHLQRLVESEYDLPDLARRMKDTTALVSRTVGQLQNDVLGLRMVPLGGVFQRLPRVVRDVAASRGKRVALHVSGQETEVDKTVADALVDPLVHLVRNAVDHGIEPPEVRRQAEKAEEGELRVEAFREGSSVVIEVRDDGAGIDPQRVREAAVTKGIVDSGAAARLSDEEALELIFTAGLSTAAEVSDISGRGVGMDVVRSNVVQVGGSVSVTSRPGHGTAFRLKIPLTLSVFRALVVEAGGGTFAVPLESVRQTANVAPEKCKTLYGRPVIPVQGRLVGMVSLAETMGLDSQCRDGDAGGERPVAVVEAVGEMVGLVVDALDPPQEILVKPLDGFLSAGGIVSGATVMGNGRVALVLDPAGLLVAALAHARGGEASARQGVEGEVR